MWIVALLACTSEPQLPPSARAGTRHTVAEVHFDRWVDYIPLQGAMDPHCRWLEPAVSDDTTPWPPLQAFWVIHENDNDVEFDAMDDVFFIGDSVEPGDFHELAGLPPLGFASFAGWQASFLNVESIEYDDDGREVRAVFGSPLDATVRIRGIEEPAGGCSTQTDYCIGDCDAEYSPLERISIVLGPFFSIDEITYE